MGQQETTTDKTTTDNDIVPNAVTAPTDPSSSIETVIDNTDITDTDTDTDTTTNQGSNNGMTTATAVPTGYSSPEETFDPDDCTVDQIVASSHCENGVASTSVYMCLGRETP